MSRESYVELCRAENEVLFSSGPVLVQYKRDKKRRRTGVVVAFKNDEGKVLIGSSKCHTRLETFEKDIGINKAVENAKPMRSAYVAADSLRELVDEMKDRAKRFWKLRSR